MERSGTGMGRFGPAGSAAVILLGAVAFAVFQPTLTPGQHLVLHLAIVMLAGFVGVLAWVRFAGRRDEPYLFTAVAFTGAALFHLLAMQRGWSEPFTSGQTTAHPGGAEDWAWFGGQMFLATLLWLGAVAREPDPSARGAETPQPPLPGREAAEPPNAIPDSTILVAGAAVGGLLLLAILTGLMPDLPRSIGPVTRPLELIAGLFFGLAVAEWLHARAWTRGVFFKYIILALALAALSQAAMAFSTSPADAPFALAHRGLAASLSLVLAGLMAANIELVRKAHSDAQLVLQSRLELLQQTTDRQAAERGLELYQHMFQFADVGFIVYRAEDAQDIGQLRLIAANPAAANLTGNTVEQLDEYVGKLVSETAPQSAGSPMMQAWHSVAMLGDVRDFGDIPVAEGPLAGEVFTARAIGLPNRHVAVMFEKVTEARKMEREVRERELQLTEAQRVSHVGSWSWDIAADRVTWSEELRRILGTSEVESDFSGFMARVHPEDRAYVHDSLRSAAETGRPFSFYHRTVSHEDQVRIVQAIGRASRAEDGTVVRLFGTAQDVTRRRRAEEALRASEERFRAVAQSANDALITIDGGGTIVFWNPAAERIFGYSEDEALGSSVVNLMPESYRERHSSGFDRLRTTGQSRIIGRTVELRGLRKDGTEMDIELSLAAWTTADGSFYTALIRDISPRKAAEASLRSFATRLEATNRELQEFAYIASHDLQEPLRKINTFGDMLRKRHTADLSPEASDYVDRMLNAARRMQSLIEDLLSFSRVTTGAVPFARVNLQAVAEEVLSDLDAAVLESGARVEIGDLPEIDADPLQMRQLLQNLLSNAIKFRRPGSHPVITVTGSLLGGANGGTERLSITIVDNGIGIDEKYADRIFMPLQRLHTRDEYAGTGMGLAICRKIVERHGGTIRAASAASGGAQFTVTLPLRQRAAPIQEA